MINVFLILFLGFNVFSEENIISTSSYTQQIKKEITQSILTEENTTSQFEKDVYDAFKKLRFNKNNTVERIKTFNEFKGSVTSLIKKHYGVNEDFSSFALKYPEEALKIINYQIMINPTDDLYYARGFIYYRLNDYDKAILDFNKIVSKNSIHNDGWTLKMLGTSYLSKGDYENAILSYTKLINTNSKSLPYGYAERAEAYIKKGDLQKAADDLSMFFKSKVLPFYKEDVSKSLSCYKLIEKGYKIEGCKDLNYFKTNKPKSYYKIIVENINKI